MAVYPQPAGTYDAIFGPQTNWPKWRSVVFNATFTEAFTDGTSNGYGEEALMGGSFSRSVTGVRTWNRWETPAEGLILTRAAGILHADGASHGWQGGALYTHEGSVGHPVPIEDEAGLYSITVACQWVINPALVAPPGPPPVGGILLRGPSDGRQMIMTAGGSGGIWGWEESSFSSEDSEASISSNATGIVPIPFDLSDITLIPFSFSQTLTETTTYHPSAPDSAGPPPYYPMRGTTSYVATSSISVTFHE